MSSRPITQQFDKNDHIIKVVLFQCKSRHSRDKQLKPVPLDLGRDSKHVRLEVRTLLAHSRCLQPPRPITDEFTN